MKALSDHRAAEFFAGLANSNFNSEARNEQAISRLAKECQQLCEGLGYPLLEKLGEPFVDKWYDTADRERRLRNIIEQVWATAVRPSLHSLFDGETIVFTGPLTLAWLNGRVLEEEPSFTTKGAGLEPEEYLQQLFYSLLYLRPFPFGRCQVCHKVFVHAPRGKPRKYCSENCKAKGIPAAANRTAYTSAYRKRKQGREQEITRGVLQTLPEEALERLGKEFPKKSRRQLQSLVKRAQRPQN